MSNWDKRFEDNPGRTSMQMFLGIFIFILVIGWVSAAAVFGLRVATAGIVGRGEAHIAIQSGSNRIAQYDKFFNNCASIKTLEGNIADQEKALAAALTPDSKQRIQDNVLGIKAMRREAINNYNADATKSYTNGQFRASSLPYQISQDGVTQCDVGY